MKKMNYPLNKKESLKEFEEELTDQDTQIEENLGEECLEENLTEENYDELEDLEENDLTPEELYEFEQERLEELEREADEADRQDRIKEYEEYIKEIKRGIEEEIEYESEDEALSQEDNESAE